MNLTLNIIHEFINEIDDYFIFEKKSDFRFYIKPKVNVSISQLREKIESALRKNNHVIDCYFVSNISYVDGKPDIEKLLKLPLVNQQLLDSLKLKNEFSGHNLAIKESSPTFEYQHVDSFLRDSTPKVEDKDNELSVYSQRLFEANDENALLQGKTLDPKDYQKTLQAALVTTVNSYPKNTIRFIKNDNESSIITYEELLQQAKNILHVILSTGIKAEDIVVLHLESSIEFVKVFWACLLGGIVALPILPAKIIDDLDLTINNLFYLSSELGKLNIVGSSDFLEKLALCKQSENSLAFQGIKLEELAASRAEQDVNLPLIMPTSSSIILLTSGSTGKPKLVLHTHASLMARSVATIEHNHFIDSDISLNWFGFDHVGALVMFHIRDVVLGISQIHISTNYVLENSIYWLEYLSKYKVTVTWAPNFAYALIFERLQQLKKRLDIDLSSMRFILNGGESINFDVAKNFLDELSSYGLKNNTMHPAWGMSETGSGVVYADSLISVRSIDNISYTSIGFPIPGCVIRIVNEKNEIVSKGFTGKLQIRSASLMQGYLQDINRAKSSFIDDNWFETGDLAAITIDGLCIVGREKDILIINGKNYSCAHLENEIRHIKGVIPDCICLLPLFNNKTKEDEIVLIIAINSSSETREIIALARQKIIMETGLSPISIIILQADQFPKTSIGKIKKSSLKQSYLNGKFRTSCNFYDALYDSRKFVRDWFYKIVWCEKNDVHCEQISLSSVLVIFKGSENDLKNAINKVKLYGIQEKIYVEIISFDNFIKEGRKYESQGLIYWDSLPSQVDNLPQEFNSQIGDLYHFIQLIPNLLPNLTAINYIKLTNNQIDNINSDWVVATHNSLFKCFVAEKRNTYYSSIYLDKSSIYDSQFDVAIIKKLLSFSTEEKIYLCKDKFYVCRFQKLQFQRPTANAVFFSNEGFYLVTGGLGGIGYELVKLLIMKGARNLLLLGRKDKSLINNFSTVMSSLATESCKIYYESIDICDLSKLNNIIDEYVNKFDLPLSKIFHTAGYFHTALTVNEDINSAIATSQPKVFGTLNLIENCKRFKNAQLLNFSSVNGYFGGASVSAYSISCAFQDAMAYIYNNIVTTLSWSMWEKIGMSENIDFSELTLKKGFDILSVQQGLSSFLECLLLDERHIFIGLNKTNRNISRLINNEINTIESVVSDNPALEQTPAQYIDKHGVNAQVIYHPVAKEKTNFEGSFDKLSQIREIWKTVLKLSNVSDDENFFDLGGHSLLLPMLQKMYKESLGVNINSVDIFKYPTIELFVTHVFSKDETLSLDQIIMRVQSIWSEKLKLDNLKVTDNFFDFGAHSLMIPEVQKQLEIMFNVTLSMVDLFKYPNIEMLSNYIYSLRLPKVVESSEDKDQTVSTQKRKNFLRHH